MCVNTTTHMHGMSGGHRRAYLIHQLAWSHRYLHLVPRTTTLHLSAVVAAQGAAGAQRGTRACCSIQHALSWLHSTAKTAAQLLGCSLRHVDDSYTSWPFTLHNVCTCGAPRCWGSTLPSTCRSNGQWGTSAVCNGINKRTILILTAWLEELEHVGCHRPRQVLKIQQGQHPGTVGFDTCSWNTY
jgi:hypothetical protein